MEAIDQTGLALQNQGVLNQQFAQALSPFNNYVAQNLQLGLQRQRIQQEQAQRVYELQLANQFRQQNEAKQFEYNKQLAKQAEDAQAALSGSVQQSEYKRVMDAERLRVQLTDQMQDKKEADLLRENPDAKRILGKKMDEYKDTPEGNSNLLTAWHQATSDPKVQENLNAGKVAGIAKQLRRVLTTPPSTEVGSPQAIAANRAFLSSPGVLDLLIKKGDYTAADIQRLQNSGDPSLIYKAIADVDNGSILPWQANSRTSQLYAAYNQALMANGAAPNGEIASRMQLANGLMKNLDVEMSKLQDPESYQKVAEAFGVTNYKTPPPPKTLGVQGISPQAGAPAAMGANPFGAPPPVPQDQLKAGPLGMFNPTPGGIPANSAFYGYQPTTPATDTQMNLQKALAPIKYANDPATEFAIRKDLLDKARTTEAVRSGLSSVLPMQNYNPQYDAFKQSKDEDQLKNLVMGLYSTPQNGVPMRIQ